MRSTFLTKEVFEISKRKISSSYFLVITALIFLLAAFSFAQSKKSDNQKSQTIQPSGFINADAYMVGPGDSLYVLIKGMDEVAWKLSISQEGTIYIPKVGEINVRSNSLSEAKKKIEQAIKEFYKNVTVFVSLAEIRKIKVGVFGDVKKSTMFYLTADTRLSALLMNTDIINQSADLRNIKIVSENNETTNCDFISFIRTNDRTNDPFLREGDFIYIDKGDKSFLILGNVKFPGTYNLKPDESVFDAITLSGGFLTNAKQDTLEVIRFADDNKTQNSFFIPLENSKKFTIQNKDKIVIRGLPEFLLDETVSIEGFVKYPGLYKIKDGVTKLSEIINQCGGFLPKASLADASLFRRTLSDTTDVEFERLKNVARKDMTDDEYDYLKAKVRQAKGKVVVNFTDIFENKISSEDIVLRKNDFISVPEKKDYVNIIGQVVKPGKVPFDMNLKVKDYISLAGGFGWRAVKSDVRVVRANTGEWIDEDEVDVLYPGDIIWIPEDPPPPKFWDFTKDALFIIGQVATVVTAAVAIIASRK